MIETLLSCPWSIVTATILFAIAWGIPYAIVLWRDTGGGQPPTIGGQQAAPSGNGGFEKMWKRLTEWLKKEKLGKNWLAFPVIMFGIILLITLAVRFFFPESLVIFGTPIRPWLLVFFGLTVWLFSRKADVEPEQLGIKKFFGKIVQKVGEGPALVPPELFTLQRFPLRQFSIQIAAGETTPTLRLLDGIVPPESLDRCQELLNEKLEVNFAPPEQAKWTLDEIEEETLENGSMEAKREMRRKIKERELTFAKDPANSRLTAEMRVTFIVRIDPKHVDDFARNIGTPEVAILFFNLRRQVRRKQLCGDIRISKQPYSLSANTWIGIKHSNYNAGYLALNEPLRARHLGMISGRARFQRRVDSSPRNDLVAQHLLGSNELRVIAGFRLPPERNGQPLAVFHDHGANLG